VANECKIEEEKKTRKETKIRQAPTGWEETEAMEAI
jgi:hypothetical protein